ncbi:MAG: ABC transporter substrate-binding protein [Leptospirales bacterium]|nr:ABC transporter substrate-binding protein [Leptospirales bacterium]
MKVLKKSTIAITALALALAIAGCGKKPNAETGKETVKIAYLPIMHALPVLAAKDFAEQGIIDSNVEIELIRFSSWPELTDALNTGRVDGASVLIEFALKAKEQEIDLKVASLGHRDGNVVIVRPEINSVGDLKGKTFAIPHRMSSHNILFQTMLKNAGVTLSEVNVVEMPPPEMLSALSEGQIDGYCVAEPFGARAVTLGVGKVLYGYDKLWKDSFCCALVLNNSFVSKRPDAAKKFIEQHDRAGERLSAHPEDAFRVAKNYFTMDDKTLKLSLDWISYDRLAVSRDIYDVLTEKMIRFKLTSSPPRYEDIIMNR